MGVRLHVRSSRPVLDVPFEAVYEFEQARIIIGRGRGADILLPHRAVSTRHVTIEAEGRGHTLVDHTSTNGTYVQGVRVVPERKKPLRDGDRIELGGFVMTFQSGIAVSAPTSRERTSSLARRLATESLDDGEVGSMHFTFMNGEDEGRRVELPQSILRYVIGRGEACDLPLRDADASREHAELTSDEGGVTVRDLGSKNGIAINGKPYPQRRLHDRDEVRIGATVLLFEDPSEASARALEEGEDVALPPPAAPIDAPAAPEPELPPEPEPAKISPRPRGGLATADVIVYGLAALVLLASAAGLVWLMRAG